MKKIVIVVTFLAAIFAATFAAGTYNVTSSAAFTDITSQCIGAVDCWVPLAGNKTAKSLAVLPDSDLYMVDTAQGCVWSFTMNGTKVWTQQTILGCGWSNVALEYSLTSTNPPLQVALLKTDSTCAAGESRLYWTYGPNGPGGGAPVESTACMTGIYAANDGSQLQLTRTPAPSGFTDGHSFFWDSTAYHDIGTGWTRGAVSNSRHACAIKGGQVYLWNSSAFEAMYLQPFPASGNNQPSALTCSFSTNATDGKMLLLVTGGGAAPKVKWYDETAAVWDTVYSQPGGVVLSQVGTLVAADQDTIFALVPGNGSTANQINNLNLSGMSVTMSVAGAENTCPTSTCPGYINHTAYAQVNWPHGGLCSGCGTQSSQSLPANNTFGITATDLTAKCSPFYSDPSDPSCTITYYGYVLCPIAGVLTPPPPPPPICGTPHSSGTTQTCSLNGVSGISIDYQSYDGSSFTWYNTREIIVPDGLFGNQGNIPIGWAGNGAGGMNVNMCAAGTVATCLHPYGVGGSWFAQGVIPEVYNECFYELEPDCSEALVVGNLANNSINGIQARGLGYIDPDTGQHIAGTTRFLQFYSKDPNTGLLSCTIARQRKEFATTSGNQLKRCQ
jgi:hypothetical protein